MVRFTGAIPHGRLLPLDSVDFRLTERPLSVKADAQIRILKTLYARGRFTPGSCRARKLG